jgi:hypothetical protein
MIDGSISRTFFFLDAFPISIFHLKKFLESFIWLQF